MKDGDAEGPRVLQGEGVKVAGSDDQPVAEILCGILQIFKGGCACACHAC